MRALELPPLPESAVDWMFTAEQMVAYGAACAVAEREACAKLCVDIDSDMFWSSRDAEDAWLDGTLACAAAISARGEE